jgi:hypothetical protein
MNYNVAVKKDRTYFIPNFFLISGLFGVAWVSKLGT